MKEKKINFYPKFAEIEIILFWATGITFIGMHIVLPVGYLIGAGFLLKAVFQNLHWSVGVALIIPLVYFPYIAVQWFDVSGNWRKMVTAIDNWEIRIKKRRKS
jgi:cytochrome b561|tara:strand:- start:23911 stop:24219 length:309 start_codon:yes stop_codon:yes gene_type:complete